MIPKAVQGEKGRVVALTCYKQGTQNVQDLTGTTLTGIIESTPPPTYTVRAISGTLTLADATNGVISWTWNATDTGTAGKFSVQIIATIGTSVIYKSFPEAWEVVRSPITPV